MNILLVEPNYQNKYPPMGLMKISRYHKNRGDYVLFCKGKTSAARIWDRIYITTLFTFDYNLVVDTINYYKSYVKSLENIFIGGIMASLMTNDLLRDTGLNNIIKGSLYDSSIIGFSDKINIDMLPLDYDILKDTDYEYPAGDNFFGYTTRGCVNKCVFCAVPELEGSLLITNNITNQINTLRNMYGDKRNLLLLDNNILGLEEEELKKIVDDLNALGFVNTPNFFKPLKIDLLIKAYNRAMNEGKSPVKIMQELSYFFSWIQSKKLSKVNREIVNNLVQGIGTTYEDEIQCILDNYELLRRIEYIYAFKRPLQRYVDFNQGMDARELTEDKMKILSKLPIRPFRIAFDDIKYESIYTKALRLADKYGAIEFSNYLLYNFSDKPVDLYKRIEINVTLSEEFGKHIYSFPMKYESIEQKNRLHIGKHWNNLYLRNVKAILNVTKGVFGGDRSFFEKAFGKNEKEFLRILSMPKELITYRIRYEQLGITQEWEKLFNNLNDSERNELINLVSNGTYVSNNERINKILAFYKTNFYQKYKKDVS